MPQKNLPPVPVRTPLLNGATISSPWTQFLNAIRQAAQDAVPQPDQAPIASTTASDLSVPIVLGGVTYYLRLSSTP